MSIGGVGGGAPMMRSFKPPTFESLDSNSIGDLTLDELKSAAPGGAQSAKSSERAEKLFAAMDADSSGSVSSDEKDAFDTKMKAAREAMQFMTQLMAGGSQPSSNEDIFANTDTDGSGGVSLDEFSAGDAAESLSTEQLSELFATIDSDSDGSITETESSDFLDTLKSAMGGAGGPPPGGGPGGPGGPPPGGPPPGGSASSSASDEEDDDTSAINLLSAATSAYASKQKSVDLFATLSSIFDQAA
jgi:Ca2+-binding EF-hand superfamily protein